MNRRILSNRDYYFGITTKNLIYYYHLDYLGTSNFITDGGGFVYEFFLNLPFGETMSEQSSTAKPPIT